MPSCTPQMIQYYTPPPRSHQGTRTPISPFSRDLLSLWTLLAPPSLNLALVSSRFDSGCDPKQEDRSQAKLVFSCEDARCRPHLEDGL